jgi:TM2 domain-containing membrane protein YozV
MTLTCPYCRTPFEPGEEPVVCTACGTAHHADCLEENRGCTVFGCSQAPVEEPKISVSSQDLTRSAAPPPPADAARTPVPPPPRRPGSPPPPPPPFPLHQFRPAQTSFVPTAPSLGFAGYAGTAAQVDSNSPYVIRKSRVAYVVLAIFFGGFGVHNFYAGYIKKAVIQCCLTVFTFLIASPVVWVWAIVEACLVDQDGDGVKFN